jgi:hypothetical protein
MISTLVIGEVLIFTGFMPDFIADALIRPERTPSVASSGYRSPLFVETPRP